VSSPEESKGDQKHSTDSETSASFPKPPKDGKKKLTEEFDEQLVKDCEERIKKLVLQFRAASDNGMFSSRQRRAFEKKELTQTRFQPRSLMV
jgi:hypothetical protein